MDRDSSTEGMTRCIGASKRATQEGRGAGRHWLWFAALGCCAFTGLARAQPTPEPAPPAASATAPAPAEPAPPAVEAPAPAAQAPAPVTPVAQAPAPASQPSEAAAHTGTMSTAESGAATPPAPSAAIAASPPAAQADADEGLKPGEFRIGKTDFIAHFGGFARLDVIYDFNGMGSKDQFVPWTIPLDGSGEPNLYFDPRKSRLFMEMRYPNSFADLGAHIEVDFFTSNNAPRIRRAFGTVGSFLFGQEWTVFTEAAWIPPTLDFESPIAYVMQRSPQLQYTQPLGVDGLDATLSAEYLQPTVSAAVTAAEPGKVEMLVPDFVLRVRYGAAGAHASLHGLLRNMFYDPDVGERVHHVGWGLNAIVGYAMEEGHRVYLQGLLGNAIGSYRGGNDFNWDADDEVQALRAYGATLGTRLFWLANRTLSSNFTGSFTHSTGDSLENTTNGKLAIYAAANVVWEPIVYFQVGLEYLYGYYADYTDRDAYNNRLQLTLQASLP